MSDVCPRLIEVALPIREISAESVRDKSLRHGHISTLHLWWARRPLAASRAVVFASLVPHPDDPRCPRDFRDAVVRHLKTDVFPGHDTPIAGRPGPVAAFQAWRHSTWPHGVSTCKPVSRPGHEPSRRSAQAASATCPLASRVEAIAMDVAMRYERGRGWTPVDVSREGEHYDVRSEGPVAGSASSRSKAVRPLDASS
jgi:hypothetical protein